MAESFLINRDESRFELEADEGVATLDFEEKEGGVLDLVSTQVPEGLQGEGVGGRLVQQALEWAEENDRRVIPTCPFVASYIEKHSGYRRLVA